MKLRGRPKKLRVVKENPKIKQFSPRGRAGRPDEVELALEEFEALRLADFEGKPQAVAAQAMHISQQTFSRILKKARKKTAEGLVSGKRISISGGSYRLAHESAKDSKSGPEIILA